MAPDQTTHAYFQYFPLKDGKSGPNIRTKQGWCENPVNALSDFNHSTSCNNSHIPEVRQTDPETADVSGMSLTATVGNVRGE